MQKIELLATEKQKRSWHEHRRNWRKKGQRVEVRGKRSGVGGGGGREITCLKVSKKQIPQNDKGLDTSLHCIFENKESKDR